MINMVPKPVTQCSFFVAVNRVLVCILINSGRVWNTLLGKNSNGFSIQCPFPLSTLMYINAA